MRKRRTARAAIMPAPKSRDAATEEFTVVLIFLPFFTGSFILKYSSTFSWYSLNDLLTSCHTPFTLECDEIILLLNLIISSEQCQQRNGNIPCGFPSFHTQSEIWNRWWEHILHNRTCHITKRADTACSCIGTDCVEKKSAHQGKDP